MFSVDEMIEKSKIAQSQWEKTGQEKIDSVVREIAKTIYDNAEEFARLTVEETKLGNIKDNISQNKRKSEIIWHSLKGKKSVGIINRDAENEIVEIAKPVGVVGVLLPVTIPVEVVFVVLIHQPFFPLVVVSTILIPFSKFLFRKICIFGVGNYLLFPLQTCLDTYSSFLFPYFHTFHISQEDSPI